ncbi:MAG: FkbM family methyltransferase [Patescibacteria group bacterium]
MSIVTNKVNPSPRFTKHIVRAGVLASTPLTVVDVGSRGGFEPQWDVYGDSARLIGFEPDAKECDKLNVRELEFRRHYPVALHRDKGVRPFYITKHDAASSFYKPYSRFLDRLPESVNRTIKEEVMIETTDLDSFLDKEGVGAVDFIKLDTEGAEYDILLGAKKALSKSVFGVSLEMLFNRQRIGEPLFSEIDLFLRKQGFVVYDLPIFRCARTVLSPHMFSDNAGPTDHGQATWTQAIYFRDAVDNILYGDSNQVWDDLRILKLASVMELFSLEDCAIELIQTAVTKGFLSSYAHGYFVDLLVPPVQGRLMRYREYVEYVRKEGPPRYIDGKKVSRAEWEAHLKK